MPSNKKVVVPEPYVHQRFPQMLYRRVGGKLVDKIVQNEADYTLALKREWKENPSEVPGEEEELTETERLKSEMTQLRAELAAAKAKK